MARNGKLLSDLVHPRCQQGLALGRATERSPRPYGAAGRYSRGLRALVLGLGRDLWVLDSGKANLGL